MNPDKKYTDQKPEKPQSKPKTKHKPTQQEVDKVFPPLTSPPMKQLPRGPNGQYRLNAFQRSLTIGQLQPWQTKVPPQQRDDYSPPEKEAKPFEQHQLEPAQLRITDYIANNSKKSKPNKQGEQNQQKQEQKQSSPSKQSSHIFKPSVGSPQRWQEKQNENDSYKIVVKKSPDEKSKGKPQSFYKNNDIYGVEDQISQSTEHNPKEIISSHASQTQELQIDHDSEKNPQAISNSHQQDVLIDGPTNITERKSINGVQILYNKEGSIIYTEQAYRQRFSGNNLQAHISPIEQTEKQQAEKDYQPDLPGVPKALQRSSSTTKLIVYQEEEELQEVLDYLGMEEQKLPQNAFSKEKIANKKNKSQAEKSKKQQTSNKDVEIDGNSKIYQEQLKTVRMTNISDINPHSNVVQQQIETNRQNSFSFVDRPHPVLNFDQRPTTEQANPNKKPTFTASKRKTQKKELFKANTASRFDTPSRQNDQDQEVRQKRQNIPQGSVYHFELIPNKASQKKNLVQVRRSSRIWVNSKMKLDRQQLQRLQQIDQSENDDATNTMTVRGRQHKTQPERQSSKSKPKISVTSKTSSKPGSKTSSDNEQITIEWLKQHIRELNEIVIPRAYMEEEYYAMTQNDEAICKFLQQLENEKEKIQIQQPQPSEEQNNRENRIMQKRQKQQQSKAKSGRKTKQSKAKSKKKVKENQSKSKPNIQIERTVELAVKNDQNRRYQNIPNDDEIDNLAPWKGPFLQEDVITQPNLPANDTDDQEPKMNSQCRPLTVEQKKQLFKENKEKHNIKEELPITVREVVDPDILRLGVFALVRLGRLSEQQFGTQYAITPLCIIKFAKKRDVLQALKQSKRLVPSEHADSIALIALNNMLIDLIEKARKKMEDREDKGDYREDEGDVEI